jgi:hypothetical protein
MSGEQRRRNLTASVEDEWKNALPPARISVPPN